MFYFPLPVFFYFPALFSPLTCIPLANQSLVCKPVFYLHALLVSLSCLPILFYLRLLPVSPVSLPWSSCVPWVSLFVPYGFLLFVLSFCTLFALFFFSPGFLLHRLCCISVYYVILWGNVGAWQKVFVLMISYDTEITFFLFIHRKSCNT